MPYSDEFNQKSYISHAEHYKEYLPEGEKGEHSKAWLATDTVDAWRHKRMYAALVPLLKLEPSAKWLTVGDGRYGTDAHYIQEFGLNVVASDISGLLLKQAQLSSFISEFSVQNAESLTYESSEFDYILCKESFHHFPRPYMALYEMLRVASKGVVLIEPNDCLIPSTLFKHIFGAVLRSLKMLITRSIDDHVFEESGNYVYTISKREMEKVALGMNYETIAFKGYNDCYVFGAEYEKVSTRGKIFTKINTRIKLLNLLTKLNIIEYGILTVIIFKQKPSDELRYALQNDGYEIIDLPRNPYIAD